MVVGKVFGLYLAITTLQLYPYITNEIGNSFSIHIYFGDVAETLLANTISNTVMVLLLVLYITILYFQHISNLKASTQSTLIKSTDANLLSQITDRKNKYIRIFTASMFLVISSVVTIANVLNGISFDWILWPSTVLLFLAIWGIIRLSDIEMNKLYPKDNYKI